MTVNGHSKDVSITTDGSIVEVEEQAALDSLSAEAKSWVAGASFRRHCPRNLCPASPAEHEGSTTLPEALPRASPDQLPRDWHLGLRCPHWLEQGRLNWEGPNYLHSAERHEIVSS